MQLKQLIAIAVIAISIYACKEDNSAEVDLEKEQAEIVEEEKILEFGFDIKNYRVKRDTIKSGDSFGEIMQRNNIGYPNIFQIAESTKDTFDIRKLTSWETLYVVVF